MKYRMLPFAVAISSVLVIYSAHADYVSSVPIRDMGYDLDYFTIPAIVGEVSSGGFHDDASISYNISPSNGRNSYMELSINGTLLNDGVTWATSNPGIGIQYNFESGTDLFTPRANNTAPNYRVNLSGSRTVATSTYIHLRYRLVRLLEKIPPGKITSAPQVTLMVHNPDGDGPSLISGVILSNILNQPKITACTVDAPTEVKLPDLYGNALVNGAQRATDVPTVKLTNCPGAISGISYNLLAVYGTQNAANGVIKGITGDGYAKNVFVQVQNSDGTAAKVNNYLPLSYTGSGNYDLPDFKVAYFINDANSVRPGKVESAIEVALTYN